MIRPLLAALTTGLAMSGTPPNADSGPIHEILTFDDLDGWEEDDHAAALAVFLNTCSDMSEPDWRALCSVARDAGNARQFFELFFRPVKTTDGAEALFTGYFEPELDGSPTPTARYRFPIYAMPPEARSNSPWLSRRDILNGSALSGRGLEICWVDDSVELFFLQVQGSGRVRFADGRTIRVGYGGANGHPYRSIGQEMVRRGIYEPHQVSADVIKNWVRRNSADGEELLMHNPSYVFFREVSEVPADKGPLGAMNRSITPMRSIAVDPTYMPLGAPVWIEKAGQTPLHRLMIAQDTGSAIKGAQRADVFIGTGDKAGRIAGALKDPGQMVVLMPIQRAYALLPEGEQ
jgi:membrane-bound lytic murein transglycosylase A